MNEHKNVYEAINAIQSDMKGVKKGASNGGLNYKFRSIEQILQELSPLCAKHGVMFVPKVIDLKSEVYNEGGKKQFVHTTTTEYTIYHTSGTSITSTMCGFGLDYSDKSLNKAHTYNLKSLLGQLFLIADNMEDGDYSNPEVKSTAKKSSKDDAVLAELRKAMIKSGIDSSFETMLLPKAKEIRAESFDEFMNQLCLIYDAMVG